MTYIIYNVIQNRRDNLESFIYKNYKNEIFKKENESFNNDA